MLSPFVEKKVLLCLLMQLLFLISDKSQKWTDIVGPLFWETSN